MVRLLVLLLQLEARKSLLMLFQDDRLLQNITCLLSVGVQIDELLLANIDLLLGRLIATEVRRWCFGCRV